MQVLLINAPHSSIGSRIPREHLPPLGLLSIGSPLIDAGHSVKLLDADLTPMTTDEIATAVKLFHPHVVLLGHSGSTSAHPKIAEITRAIRANFPSAQIVYGGVFPTFHWYEILEQEPQIDVIVRGEGEETIVQLLSTFETNGDLSVIPGLAFRHAGIPTTTGQSPVIRDLDSCRVGWELINPRRYSYWGDKRAVVVQFSRGCPHHCNYCGQRGFWKTWRHRDPVKFAAEIAWLHRQHGIDVFNFADENPTASRSAWKAFLEALIAQNVEVTLVGSTRADDIVRDADILHLYKKAGVARWLLGIENYNEETLRKVNKNAATATDRRAIQLLREHKILSMATWVIGFDEETDRDYLYGLRQLLSYDPDQIQIVFATPHRWTPYYQMEAQRPVIQTDMRRWDYKHQVLATRHMSPWRVLLWMKFIEAVMQLRPRALWRYLAYPDRSVRDSIHWYYRVGRKVWFHEIRNFLFRDHRLKNGPKLHEFWGQTPDEVSITSRSQRTLVQVGV